MPEHLQVVVTGGMPRPRPDRSTRELRSDAAATLARLDVALQRRSAQAQCHWCESGLYSVPQTGCPACGRITTHNGADLSRGGHVDERGHLPELPIIRYGLPSPVLGVR